MLTHGLLFEKLCFACSIKCLETVSRKIRWEDNLTNVSIWNYIAYIYIFHFTVDVHWQGVPLLVQLFQQYFSIAFKSANNNKAYQVVEANFYFTLHSLPRWRDLCREPPCGQREWGWYYTQSMLCLILGGRLIQRIDLYTGSSPFWKQEFTGWPVIFKGKIPGFSRFFPWFLNDFSRCFAAFSRYFHKLLRSLT